MSDPITIHCPHCKGSLKLKNSNSVGKKVPCPKCKKPFVVKAPAAAEDDDLAFLDASESDAAVPMEEGEEDEFAEAAAPKPSAKSGGGKKKSRKKASAEVNWFKPLMIGLAALVVVGLLIGGGVVAVSMLGQSENKIDLTYLPADADAVIQVRVDEVMNSPFLQPLVAKPEARQFLDKFAAESHVQLADVKSITIGGHKPPDAAVRRLTQPGFGAAGPQSALAPFSSWVVVIRTSRDLPADLMTKLPGMQATEYGGKSYFRPATAAGNGPSAFQPAAQILVIADATQIQRIIDEGPKQKRRPEFDFIDNKPQIILAELNQPGSPAAPPAANGASAGGPRGMPNLLETVRSNTKGFCYGASFTQDIEFQLVCYSPDALAVVRPEMDKLAAGLRAEYQLQKPQISPMLEFMGLRDLLVHVDATVESFKVSEMGSNVMLTATMPGAIRASIEKGITTFSGRAQGAMGNPGGPNPFGGQPPGGGAGPFPPPTENNSGNPPNSTSPTVPQ